MLRVVVLQLSDPKPHPLHKVPRLPLRPDLSIDRRLAGPDIRFGGLDEGRALVDLPENVEDDVECYWDICRDKVLDVPLSTHTC